MIAVMYAYVGSRRWRCPDCRELLRLPHDYSLPALEQTQGMAEHVHRIVGEHALEAPLLHPTVLPGWHAAGRRAVRR